MFFCGGRFFDFQRSLMTLKALRKLSIDLKLRHGMWRLDLESFAIKFPLAVHANNQKWLPHHKRRKNINNQRNVWSVLCIFSSLFVRLPRLFYEHISPTPFVMLPFSYSYVSFSKVEERRKDRDSCTHKTLFKMWGSGEWMLFFLMAEKKMKKGQMKMWWGPRQTIKTVDFKLPSLGHQTFLLLLFSSALDR